MYIYVYMCKFTYVFIFNILFDAEASRGGIAGHDLLPFKPWQSLNWGNEYDGMRSTLQLAPVSYSALCHNLMRYDVEVEVRRRGCGEWGRRVERGGGGG